MNERFCTQCQQYKKSVDKGKTVPVGNRKKWICEMCVEMIEKRKRSK